MRNLIVSKDYFMFFVLVALMFVLPVWEAPKNILAGIFVIFGVVFILRKSIFSDGFVLFSVLFVLATFLGTFFAYYPTPPVASLDVFRTFSVGLVVYLSGIKHRMAILWSIVAGCIFAIFHGAYSHFFMGVGQYWVLHSVGHVNQSAIYAAIVSGVVFAILLAFWKEWGWRRRVMSALPLSIVFSYVTFGESRAAALAVFVLFVALIFVFFGFKLRAILFSAVLIGSLALLMIFSGARVIEKQLINQVDDNVLSFRDSVWKSGLIAVEKAPVFGLGTNNYIKVDMIGVPFKHTSHAHNIYVNKFVEEGVWGLLWLIVFLFGWAWLLWCWKPNAESDSGYRALWMASFSACFITLVVGVVNTTFNVEHGLLSMVLLSLWLGRVREIKNGE